MMQQFASMMNYDEVNGDMRRWARKNVPLLRGEMRKLNIKHIDRSPSPVASEKNIRSSTYKRGGLVQRIGYTIPRHMVFVHKGVGRGTPIEKAGSTNRKAKPWFNPVIDKHMDELADIVAEGLGREIINKIFIK